MDGLIYAGLHDQSSLKLDEFDLGSTGRKCCGC